MRINRIFVFICILMLSFSIDGKKHKFGVDTGFDNGAGVSVFWNIKAVSCPGLNWI